MWPVQHTRRVYDNQWITVDEDAVVLPDGRSGRYGVVTVRQPAVFVVALDEADRVVLVEVDRHTTGAGLEIPAGGSDGEEPLLAARRELAEEAGLRAAHWREIGRMDALNGICRAPEIVFLATGLQSAGGAADSQREEGITGVHYLPWSEVLHLVRDGTIRDGESVAALMYAALALGRVT